VAPAGKVGATRAVRRKLDPQLNLLRRLLRLHAASIPVRLLDLPGLRPPPPPPQPRQSHPRRRCGATVTRMTATASSYGLVRNYCS
jgi:hypothetical protein